MNDDMTWCLAPHGKSYEVASWVVQNYKLDTYPTKMQAMWVDASQQILDKLASRNLIRNAIQTPDGTILESTHRHDYKEYKDANGLTYMVDGGLEYLRRSSYASEPYIEMSLYDDEPHSVQREVLKWGTYSINGDQPLKFVTIAEMDTAHLEAVVKASGIRPELRNCMIKELECRQDIHLTTAVDFTTGHNLEVTADQRRSAKAINFGLIHGMEIK